VKDQAIVDLLSDKSLNELALKIAGDNSGDLIQEVALLLLEMEEEKWTEINEGGYLRWYVIRTMLNMATSSRSTFSRKYELHQYKGILRDVEDSEGYDFEKEEDIALLEVLLERHHWYDRDMLKLYLKEGSYRKVSAATGIPFKSVGNTVKKTLTKLRKDYYGIITERLIRSSGLPYFCGGSDDGLED
jgi:DNA-directed RNA polymerase specialized sigma24 family protein